MSTLGLPVRADAEQEQVGGSHPSLEVAVIVVTYRRPELLYQTLDAVVGQTSRAAVVCVVDNGADPSIAETLGTEYPAVTYLSATSNLGPGGGFQMGLQYLANEASPDWYWLLDDDSPPSLDALEQALDVAQTCDGPIGAIGLRGGHVRRGRIRHDLPLGTVTSPERADFLLVDGSIISAEAVRRAGYPRADFFIMMEDLEFSFRIGETGLPLLVRPADGSINLYQGSGAPWRGYYQSRNHLRMALERRSITWMWGWLMRELAINLHHVRHRRWASIRFRLRGAVDGTLNRMGRTIDPVPGNPASSD
jgi:rhamnopyranosyl-N-acetylglucosaminyl-diphospho-decaprenol beta-1,3/1,4-galactofuranosyltransferase